MTYYIVPKKGYTVDDIINDGANFKNARIVRYGLSGTIIEEYDYSWRDEERFKAKLHPSFFRPRTLWERAGRSITLKGALFEGVLADGVDPYWQIAWLMVKERGAALPNDVITYIIEDEKMLKNITQNRKWLEGVVKYLRDQGYLDMREGRLQVGERELPIGFSRIYIKKGYNPILYEMVKEIRRRGGVIDRGDLANYMIRDIGWITRDPVLKMGAEEKFDHYISMLVRRGVIREIGRGVYEFVKPLERYS